jgi:release factor glutamine methyltransferase
MSLGRQTSTLPSPGLTRGSRGREGPAPEVREGGGSPTVGSALAEAAAALAAAGFDEPRRSARNLLEAALGRSAAEIFAHPEDILGPAQATRVAKMLGRMIAHEPLSRIIGKREFWGLEFLLSPDTLDPRPESETVVETVLARLPDRTRPYRFLDLGTGTGCLLLALLSEFPRGIGIGIDVATGAARTARRNANLLGLGARAHFVVGDWARAVTGGFDAIVANPPYIATPEIAELPREVRDYDPHLALHGGADGLLAYRAIAVDLPRLLLPGGLFAAEIGWEQAEPVAAILTQSGLAIEGFIPDLAGITRCVVARK